MHICEVPVDLTTVRAEERALMTAVGRGDRTAYAELDARYRPLIAYWVRRYLADAWVVDEVTQDVLFELWTVADRFDPARAVAPWVRTVTQRRATDRLRGLRADRDRDMRIGARDPHVVDHARRSSCGTWSG